MASLVNYSTETFSQFLSLTKPRVNFLIVFCAMIGMVMAWYQTPQHSFSLSLFIYASVGIGMVSGAAAAVNCLIERQIDSKMARTAWRPLPSGTLTVFQTLFFASILGVSGFIVLATL